MKITIEIRRPGWMTSVRLRRARPLLLLVALVLAGPVLATDRFSDVPADSVHHANINAIAAAGITLGCNAGGTLYCPDTVVTRDQMGSFLARAAGLGANPPVANADLLDGLDSTAFAPAGPLQLDRNSAFCTAATNNQFTCSVDCDPGMVVIGGGASSNAVFADDEQLVSSYPLDDNTWTMKLQKRSGTASSLGVYAICTPA